MDAEAYRHAPHDIDVEQALLGAILVDNRAMERASALIRPEHFYDPLHGRIFATMAQMIDLGGVVVTPLTLHATMKADPGVMETGGQAYFDALRAAAPALPNIRDLSNIIADLATRRRLIRIGEDIVNAAYDGPSEKSAQQQIAEAENAICAIAEATGCDGAALPIINMLMLDGLPIPERRDFVPGRIPDENVTLFSGEGAAGKTLLAQQLMCSTVLGTQWLGIVPQQGPALGIFCEDDADELHRQFARIAEHHGVTFSKLGDLCPISLAGRDTVFAVPDRDGIMRPTALYWRTLRLAEDIKPRVIVLDTAADIFAGNEIDRAQVRQFVGLLRSMAIKTKSALVLTAHPSLAGISSGSGISGSTAWHNSVRARLYLRRPKQEGDEAVDADERVLECLKQNYGPAGETIKLRWQNGLFVPTEGAHWIDKRKEAIAAEDLFLQLLARFAKQGRNVSDKKNAPTYAPAMFANDPEAAACGIKKAALATAMNSLFAGNKIHVASYGRPSRQYQKLAVGPHP